MICCSSFVLYMALEMSGINWKLDMTAINNPYSHDYRLHKQGLSA